MRNTPLCLSLVAIAAQAFSAARASDPLPIGFQTPELTLADFNTRELHHGDFNADGKPDLVVINTSRGRLDFFTQKNEAEPRATPVLRKERWEPILSHPRFERESLIPDSPVFAIEVGDFNGDGQDDFAITDEQNRLHMYHGPMVMAWKPVQKLATKAANNAPGTLLWDADRKALLLLGEESIEEVTWSKKEKTYSLKTIGAPPKGENPRELILMDVNADGKKDVLYSLRSPRYNLAVHVSTPEGLGNAYRPPMDPPAAIFTPLPGSDNTLLALHQRSGALLQFTFAPPENAELNPEDGPDIRFIHIPPLQTPQLLWTELDGSGQTDMILLSKGKPEIHYGIASRNNQFADIKTQPIPVACSWMIEGDFVPGHKGNEFILHDPDTGYLGLTSYSKDRIQVPANIPNSLSIIGAASWAVPGEKQARILGIVRDSSRKYHAKVWKINQQDDQFSLELIQELALPDVKRDPNAPLLVTQTGDIDTFFLVSSPLSESFFLIPDADNILTIQTTAEGFSTSLLERKNESDFLSVPRHAPLPTEWVSLKDSSVQFLKLNLSGQVEVVDQINMKETGKISALLPLDADGRQLALLDSNKNRLEIHRKRENGTYEYERDIHLPPLQPIGSRLFGDPKRGYHLRIQGRNQITLLYPRSPQTEVTSTTLYETDLPETFPRMILTGDFNGDTTPEITLIDNVNQHTMEFLERTETKWTSRLHFQMFDTSPGAAGRRGGNQEPREVVVTDINGDTLDDIVLLIHDRILLYLQDAVPELK
jgi:hypothetical protein